MNIILLSGGSGTRLWPLSNEVRSKQFLKIFRDKNGNHESMVQRMYRMIREVDPNSSITVATSQNQVASIKNQLGNDVDVSIEPYRRDTFPAIVLSVAYLHDIKGLSDDEPVAICPVDPFVEIDYFYTIKRMYENVEESCLCLMGIVPTYPSEKYGYIISKGNQIEFKEKPNKLKAIEYIKNGALWNGGVFAFNISYILKKAEAIYGTCNYYELLNRYKDLDKKSFDYVVAEKEKNIKVLEYSGEWRDLGTWNTFTEAMQDEIGGYAILGENCHNVHVVNELSIPVVGLGLSNVIIAATPDGILVSDKNASGYLKEYVPNNRPMYEKSLWGEYKVLDFQINNKEKNMIVELTILPNRSVDYQKHNHRKEIWVITSGTGFVLINDLCKRVVPGDVVNIEKGNFHSAKAIEELHIIEIQIGKEIMEEDIEIKPFEWDKLLIN